LGKIKVYELAKELGITNAEVIENLRKFGVEAKSHLSVIESDIVKKIKTKIENDKKNGNDRSQMHIIRRNIKVINTDGDKEEIEEITTNISGGITKSHQTSGVESKKENNEISSENLNKPFERRQGKQNKSRFGTRTTNVVITRNGKPIDTQPSKESKKEDKKQVSVVENKTVNEKEEKLTKDLNKEAQKKVSKEESKDMDRKNNNVDTRSNVKDKPNFANNTQTNSKKEYSNRQNNDNRKFNDNRQYNKQNNGYNRQNNNNNYSNNNRSNYKQNYDAKKPFNINQNKINNQGYQKSDRPFKNGGGYNRNNNGGYSNNTYSNNGYNNNKNYQNNTAYQVNKFIKQSASIDQKETREREYDNSYIDKKKYNTEKNLNDNKKDKLDKNKLREKNTRISTSKLKNLEVNSRSLMDLYERESDLSRNKSSKKKKQEKSEINQTKIIPMTEVKLPEIMTVKEFAESIKKQASEIIKKLFNLGIMATVNQEIDFDTAYLVAEEFGITAQKDVKVTEEDILFDESEDDEKDLEVRPPIVVVMGHVDHGKTSLLDKIRSTNVVNKEAGGITQHIGAYKVKCNDREICFLDTPGHEAFTAMRARGAQVTDIAIIVVAADDGIKPQTIEAIDHAKAAGVSIIVAINKIDKPNANVERVKQELLEVGLVAEEWGGDTICVPISAMTGEGIDTLLEMILLVADVKELKANPNKQSKGTILEARLDKHSGTIVSMLVQRGTLNVGDTIVVGDVIGKVRAMKDDKGRKVKEAGPSTPVEVLGLSHVPQTGEVFYEVENEKVAKQLVSRKIAESRVNLIKQGQKVTLGDLFNQIKEGKIKELNVIIKADVEGSVEALKDSLEKLSNEEVRVRVLHASTGAIKETDITLASVSNAIVIGFNVRPDSVIEQLAKKENIDLRLYRVIYDAIDDVETAMKGMLAPKYREEVLGKTEIRRVFKITNVGVVAGCYAKEGKVVRGTMVRLIRDSIVLHEAKIDSLKREKDDVKEVAAGYECGIKLENYSDIKEGDILECFQIIEEKRG